MLHPSACGGISAEGSKLVPCCLSSAQSSHVWVVRASSHAAEVARGQRIRTAVEVVGGGVCAEGVQGSPALRGPPGALEQARPLTADGDG